mgnify:CR=1 FL=1
MVMDPTLPRISVRDLMMQAFLTGWELSDKTVSQDEYLQSSIQVIEMLQVEPENLYAEEGLGLPDGEEGRRQAVSGRFFPQAGEPFQCRELRQFQSGPAPLLKTSP